MKFITKQQAQGLRRRLTTLYGEQAPELMDRFFMLLGRYGVGDDVSPHTRFWGPNDVLLITYADTISDETGNRNPLQCLHDFCNERLRGAISIVHLLPFSPWSSDDGFSVIDYRKVEPSSGDWVDVVNLGEDFNLMFDLVLNHCSKESAWFRDYVMGVAPGCYYFHPTDPEADLSKVVRPRPWPLLTEFNSRYGKSHVWTTFSEDQVDLNWSNPDVLFEFLDILFLYIEKGCRILRLDAIAFLWKEIGTDCMHRPETHEVVKLFRDVLEIVAPDVVLLTETNVPHDENISYFGQGDEAHMVYNFSLPPLLLHALLRGDTQHLTAWADTLPALPPGQTFLNFSSSHDGIGVRPLQGILATDELMWIANEVKARGGQVSMRSMPDGSEQPYELNCSYIDALKIPDDEGLSMARFFCSQAVVLAFRGVPAVYIQNLIGGTNWVEGFEETGRARTLNRRQWKEAELKAALDENTGSQARIFARYHLWLERRGNHSAFSPDASQVIRDVGTELFCFVRISPIGGEHIVCLFNFSKKRQTVALSALDESFEGLKACRDILSHDTIKTDKKGAITLDPYFAYWLTV
jgi:sucrose phosphorylase|tara:strand:- start:4490 stop:6226 length:1737 start_codon:yes stop_codon:yes gene_type:complete